MGELNLLPLQVYRNETTRWIGKCSCGERPFDCEVWSDVIQTAIPNPDSFLRDPLNFILSDTGIEEESKQPFDLFRLRIRRGFHWALALSANTLMDLANYRQRVARRDRIVKAYAERRGGVSWIVDSSKDPLQMFDLARYSSLKVRVIFLTRDVRGVAWSAIRSGRSDAAAESRSWSMLNGRILKLVEKLEPGSWMNLHYEDLCANPDETLARLFEFLDLTPETDSPQAESEGRHTIGGNEIRFKPLESFREDVAWVENLDGQDLAVIEKYAGKTARRLGYAMEKEPVGRVP